MGFDAGTFFAAEFDELEAVTAATPQRAGGAVRRDAR